MQQMEWTSFSRVNEFLVLLWNKLSEKHNQSGHVVQWIKKKTLKFIIFLNVKQEELLYVWLGKKKS